MSLPLLRSVPEELCVNAGALLASHGHPDEAFLALALQHLGLFTVAILIEFSCFIFYLYLKKSLGLGGGGSLKYFVKKKKKKQFLNKYVIKCEM